MFRFLRRDARSSAGPRRKKPGLSIVVVVRNMPREARRTLLSLSAGYQRRIGAAEYEVIVVDNGSDPPFDPRSLEALGGNFRLIRIDQASPSPAAAVNRGIAAAEGSVIGVMVDGARIATPGLLHFGRRAARLAGTAVVTTLGWDLGHDFQRFAVECGYDQAREDDLLASIDWPRNGYRLFEIGTPDESSWEGWLSRFRRAARCSWSEGIGTRSAAWTSVSTFLTQGLSTSTSTAVPWRCGGRSPSCFSARGRFTSCTA